MYVTTTLSLNLIRSEHIKKMTIYISDVAATLKVGHGQLHTKTASIIFLKNIYIYTNFTKGKQPYKKKFQLNKIKLSILPFQHSCNLDQV